MNKIIKYIKKAKGKVVEIYKTKPNTIVCNKKRYLEFKKFKEYDEKTDTILGLKFYVKKYLNSNHVYVMDSQVRYEE